MIFQPGIFLVVDVGSIHENSGGHVTVRVPGGGVEIRSLHNRNGHLSGLLHHIGLQTDTAKGTRFFSEVPSLVNDTLVLLINVICPGRAGHNRLHFDGHKPCNLRRNSGRKVERQFPFFKGFPRRSVLVHFRPRLNCCLHFGRYRNLDAKGLAHIRSTKQMPHRLSDFFKEVHRTTASLLRNLEMRRSMVYSKAARTLASMFSFRVLERLSSHVAEDNACSND